MALRTYVAVTTQRDGNGNAMPKCIMFRRVAYEIDEVLDVRKADAINAGGCGLRHTIRMGLYKTYLFLEDSGRWFVEERVPCEITRVGGLVEQYSPYRF